MRCLLLTFSLLLVFPAIATAQREKLPPEDRSAVQARWPQAERMATGLYTQVLVPSQSGRFPKPGDEVAVL